MSSKSAINGDELVDARSPEAIAEQLLQIFGAIMRSGQAPLVQFAEQYNLTLSQLKVLFVLSSREQPQAVSELARATTLSLPAAGRAVDAVVRSGLVSRSEDPDDRRVKRIALTETGRQVADEINERRAATLRELVMQMSPDDRSALASALDPLVPLLPDCSDSVERGGTDTTD